MNLLSHSHLLLHLSVIFLVQLTINMIIRFFELCHYCFASIDLRSKLHILIHAPWLWTL
jgi:hypothetical protein